MIWQRKGDLPYWQLNSFVSAQHKTIRQQQNQNEVNGSAIKSHDPEWREWVRLEWADFLRAKIRHKREYLVNESSILRRKCAWSIPISVLETKSGCRWNRQGKSLKAPWFTSIRRGGSSGWNTSWSWETGSARDTSFTTTAWRLQEFISDKNFGRSKKLKDFLNEGKATGRVGRQPAFPFSKQDKDESTEVFLESGKGIR